MTSIFIQQAMLESGMPQPQQKIVDNVFGTLTFVPNVWTKYIHLSYFGIEQNVPIYIHTVNGSINNTQYDCYTEFTNDVEGVLSEYKYIFKNGIKIDSLVFQLDSLVVILTGNSESDYMVLEFEA